MLNGKSILITGGTGSFGKAFVVDVLQRYKKIKRLVVFSRDELKQYEMAQHPIIREAEAVRFFLGDVRDKSRLYRALKGVDIVIHAAALKQVPAAEYNPLEFINTNIRGGENLIEAALDSKVEQVIALSTDKAVAPVNLYGATKLCSEKLFVAANHYAGSSTKFTVVRYGNVFGSRGSVVPYFLEMAQTGTLPLTNREMTRFNITLSESIDLVLWAIENSEGGEILVPKIPSYRLIDLAEAIGPSCEQKIIGVRPGEKIHEEMISANDSVSTVDLGDIYAVLPSHDWFDVDTHQRKHSATPVSANFAYNSETNPKKIGVGELRELILEHIDPSFEPI
jgi:UDP-N-acetylglucosamine 4,6-dehydratase/5-epimerase